MKTRKVLLIAKKDLRLFKERLNAGLESINARKEQVYDDKEHFDINKERSHDNHVEGIKGNNYTDDSEATTSAALASNSQETIRSEYIENSDKIKKGRIVKKDFFRFR